jgi:hypothetical protein
MVSATIKSNPKTGYEGAVMMAVDYALFSNLAKLALSKDASIPAKAIAMLKLEQLKAWFTVKLSTTADEEWRAFYSYLNTQIGRLQDNPDEFKQENLLPAPPGQPIGSDDFCGN